MAPEERRRANCRAYTNVLVKRGVLKREPCACGATKVQAHHPDYTNPRLVIWVCRPCHIRTHKIG